MVGIIFSIIIITASIYMIKKNTYIYMFVALYLLLPDYLAISINDVLPLITLNRCLIVLLFVDQFIVNKQKDISYKPKNTDWLVIAFFVILCIPNFYHIVNGNVYAIKNLLGVLLENIMIYYIFIRKIRTEKSADKALRVLIYASAVAFFFGIFESLTGLCIEDLLYIANRHLLNVHALRLGVLRSVFTFALPPHFAMYCTVMIPLIIYEYMRSKEKKFLVILFLCLNALVLSGSRANIIFALVVMIIYFFFQKNENKKIYLSGMFRCIIAFLICITMFSTVSRKMNYFYTGMGKSVLNVFGFNFNLEEGAPEGVAGFGGNEDSAVYSRTFQLSGFQYVANKNFIFGLGADALLQGKMFYNFESVWQRMYTCDIGYLMIFIEEGLLGIIAYTILICIVLVKIIKDMLKKRSVQQNACLFMFIITYLMCIVVTGNQMRIFWLVFSILSSKIISPSSGENKEQLIK